MVAPMKKIILATTLALVSTVAASSAFAGGCQDTYSYDTYSGGTYSPYTPTYSGGYSGY